MLHSYKIPATYRAAYISHRIPTLDHYDTSITLNGERYCISFLPALQHIVYTSLDTGRGGEFDVINGYIHDNEPEDEILKSELRIRLEINKSVKLFGGGK